MVSSPFNGNILFLGCGSVAQCTIPLVPHLLDVNPDKITIIDFEDNRDTVIEMLKQGVKYKIERITPDNFAAILAEHVGDGDIIIDLAWNIETMDLIKWCRDTNVRYINTSVEVWDPYGSEVRKDPRKYTLYARQMQLLELMKSWGDNEGPSAILDHGANPGLVSHFTKKALLDIAARVVEEKPKDKRISALCSAVEEYNFKKLAQLLGVKTIHVSERDSQIVHLPKRVNEFVNTWSVEGLYEESLAPAEMGWGTHEETLPAGGFTFDYGPQNQICLSSIGMNTPTRSWVPSGEIVGMVIRHGEAFGISDRLTVWQGDKAIYRPTVHYVYCPSDAAIASLHELRMRQYALQPTYRILKDEIIDGVDELGVLLMGHDLRSWWTGSVLSIHEARCFAPHQNATTLQVAISVLAAVDWMVRNPRAGVRLPDDIDHDHILDFAKPYLGTFVSQEVDWGPLDHLDQKYTTYNRDTPKTQNDSWQFDTFRLGLE